MSYYAYPGTKADFQNEFGGVPKRTSSVGNIFLIAVIIIVIAIIITAIAFLSTTTKQTFIDNTGLFNLDNLTDLNKPTIKCCVFLGQNAPNETYLYDPSTNITYSLQKPTSINTVCNTFPDPGACITANTDSKGNIIPVATFSSQAYFTYENDQAAICHSTTTCPTQ